MGTAAICLFLASRLQRTTAFSHLLTLPQATVPTRLAAGDASPLSATQPALLRLRICNLWMDMIWLVCVDFVVDMHTVLWVIHEDACVASFGFRCHASEWQTGGPAFGGLSFAPPALTTACLFPARCSSFAPALVLALAVGDLAECDVGPRCLKIGYWQLNSHQGWPTDPTAGRPTFSTWVCGQNGDL